ncbi:hypothetical protein QWZ14_21255 [Paeniroseomonas aquatica]|uniref:Uncharacterized protein n=1 Tax=Paeniroseomonas aquatica TaxID=373043 RepID=A0ABT8AAZ7_9PROT|nr:hypothetical protein [Paeniroseomonas aquatica]MDN3566914.1 hypothetical protein [Paeniroseomonas aquatica]
MRRIGGSAVMLGMVALLSGCAVTDRASYGVANGIATVGERIGAPWGGMAPKRTEDSDTIARVRGEPRQLAGLETEPGNVWPAQEGPRATLANPDAALRNIPSYRPGELDRMSAPAGRSTWQPEDPPPVRPMPPGLSGSSSPPPPPIRAIDPPRASVVPPPLSQPGPAPRADGRVYPTPGGNLTTTGGTDRVQTYVAPGGGTGTIHNDGGISTIYGPNGQVQTMPTPR